jgi:hypothetical protein
VAFLLALSAHFGNSPKQATVGGTVSSEYAIDLAGALLLCGGAEQLPAGKESLLLAASQPSDWLCMRAAGRGYVLWAGNTDTARWADVFGVVPYAVDQVALRESAAGPWEDARRRAEAYRAHNSRPGARRFLKARG